MLFRATSESSIMLRKESEPNLQGSVLVHASCPFCRGQRISQQFQRPGGAGYLVVLHALTLTPSMAPFSLLTLRVPPPNTAFRPLSAARGIRSFCPQEPEPQKLCPNRSVPTKTPPLTLTSSLNLGSSLEVGLIIVRSSFSSAGDKGDRVSVSGGGRLSRGSQLPSHSRGDELRAENLAISSGRVSQTALHWPCSQSHRPGAVADCGNCLPDGDGPSSRLHLFLKGIRSCSVILSLMPHRLPPFGETLGEGTMHTGLNRLRGEAARSRY